MPKKRRREALRNMGSARPWQGSRPEQLPRPTPTFQVGQPKDLCERRPEPSSLAARYRSVPRRGSNLFDTAGRAGHLVVTS